MTTNDDAAPAPIDHDEPPGTVASATPSPDEPQYPPEQYAPPSPPGWPPGWPPPLPSPTGDPCAHIAWRGFVPQHVDFAVPANVLQAAVDLARSPLVAIAQLIATEPPRADREALLEVFRERLRASPGMAGHMPRICAALERIAAVGEGQLQRELDAPGGIFGR